MRPKDYAALPSKDDEQDLEIRPRNQLVTTNLHQEIFLNTRTIAYLVGLFVFTTVVIATSNVLLFRNCSGRCYIEDDDQEFRGCGSSVAEAKAAGCVFDLMLNGWVQPECYQRDLSEEFISKGLYHFYYDHQATQEIPLDIMRKGEHKLVYTSPVHHFDHCSYMWRVQVRALQTRGPIDTESLDYNHTVHCAGVLENFYVANSTSFGNESTLGVGFTSCGPFIRTGR